ncbi:hypothetical protein HDV05_003766 [Chytridiales sp. JEL 0842]|nr:hypothetical protein HDV05_003766 [Chytridiales sp. JEL 0842]
MSKSFYDNNKGDTNFRRTWNKEEYLKKAIEREENARILDSGKKPPKKPTDEAEAEEIQDLKPREDYIDFSSIVNKTTVVQITGAVTDQPGFPCKVCNVVLKDSVAYLDHINGRKHQLNMGMSMKVERSTVEDVKATLERLARRKRGEEKKEPDLNLKERVELAIKKEEEEKEAKKEERKLKKQKKAEEAKLKEEEHQDQSVAELMGFGGFGSSKK